MQPLSLLADDRPEEARQLIEVSIGRWSPEEYNIQNMTALMGASYVNLYRGDPQSSLDRHRKQWSALKGAFLLRSQICRLLVGELRARSALALAFKGGKPAPLLREVEKRARSIESEDIPYGNALAMLLRGAGRPPRRSSPGRPFPGRSDRVVRGHPHAALRGRRAQAPRRAARRSRGPRPHRRGRSLDARS